MDDKIYEINRIISLKYAEIKMKINDCKKVEESKKLLAQKELLEELENKIMEVYKL